MSFNFTDFFSISTLKRSIEKTMMKNKKMTLGDLTEQDWDEICLTLRKSLSKDEQLLLAKQLQHDAQDSIKAEEICKERGIIYRAKEWGWKDGKLQRLLDNQEINHS